MEWTTDTLYTHFTAALLALDERTHERVNAQEDVARAAMVAAAIASDKAERATEKRFDGVNEFRETLKNQQALFVTRSEVYALVGAACTVMLIVAHYLPR
jgi:hypothetical protein